MFEVRLRVSMVTATNIGYQGFVVSEHEFKHYILHQLQVKKKYSITLCTLLNQQVVVG